MGFSVLLLNKNEHKVRHEILFGEIAFYTLTSNDIYNTVCLKFTFLGTRKHLCHRQYY